MNPIAFLRALRPHQWSKNVFVLAALVFAAGEVDSKVEFQAAVIPVLLAFAAFCLTSSAVYLLNDVVDVEKDRLHAKKKFRPIAAGEVSIPTALFGSVALVLAGLALGFAAAGKALVVVLLVYAAINLAYSFRLKHVVLVDAFCIAAGFLLRVEAGGRAAGVDISHWAYLCMLFLALFLALNKRRAEVMQVGEGVGETRKSLREYSLSFLDQMVGILAACTIVCYTMYTVDEDTIAKFGEDRLVFTVPFVVFGIGRYMVLVHNGVGGDSPARILLGGDAWFLMNSLAFAATLFVAVFQR